MNYSNKKYGTVSRSDYILSFTFASIIISVLTFSISPYLFGVVLFLAFSHIFPGPLIAEKIFRDELTYIPPIYRGKYSDLRLLGNDVSIFLEISKKDISYRFLNQEEYTSCQECKIYEYKGILKGYSKLNNRLVWEVRIDDDYFICIRIIELHTEGGYYLNKYK